MKTKEFKFRRTTMQEAFNQLPKLMRDKGWMNSQGIQLLLQKDLTCKGRFSMTIRQIPYLMRCLIASGVPIEKDWSSYRLSECNVVECKNNAFHHFEEVDLHFCRKHWKKFRKMIEDMENRKKEKKLNRN